MLCVVCVVLQIERLFQSLKISLDPPVTILGETRPYATAGEPRARAGSTTAQTVAWDSVRSTRLVCVYLKQKF